MTACPSFTVALPSKFVSLRTLLFVCIIMTCWRHVTSCTHRHMAASIYNAVCYILTIFALILQPYRQHYRQYDRPQECVASAGIRHHHVQQLSIMQPKSHGSQRCKSSKFFKNNIQWFSRWLFRELRCVRKTGFWIPVLCIKILIMSQVCFLGVAHCAASTSLFLCP